jgi:hypothetical protein
MITREIEKLTQDVEDARDAQSYEDEASALRKASEDTTRIQRLLDELEEQIAERVAENL